MLKMTLGLIAVATLMTACSLSSDEELKRKNERIESLQRDLQEQTKKASDEATLRAAVEAHQMRMLSCNRDFLGSYGQLIQKKVHLVRETARTLYYDCSGKLSLDDKSTTKAPRDTIPLPELKSLNTTSATIVLKNRETCGSKGFSLPLTRFGTPSLWVDRANALLTHEVFAGRNHIDFGLCDASGKTENISKDCARPTWVATLELDVTEEEKLDSRVVEVRRSAAECAADKEPRK